MKTNSWYKSLLEELIKNIDIGVHIVDEKGNTIFYNEAMADLEGLSADNVMNKNILEVFPTLNTETSTLLNVILEKKPIYNSRQSYLNNKGQQIDTINTTVPVKVANGLHGALELAKDITKEEQLSKQLEYLKNELATQSIDDNTLNGYTFRNLIGSDESFLRVIEMAKRAANSTSTVFIYGETGTGKELFAQSIHNGGNRSSKPFIAQNCAALPESLLEGILFGTEKGSFTGAISRPGLFEQADEGTLLLDEINSMSLPLQAKLLRVLQEGYVRRLGGIKDIRLNVRIIATTNEDPFEMMKNNTLRKDLYYRLNVISINIPPLRKRSKDILILADHFIKKYNALLDKNIWYISDELKEAFSNYDWPGNIRELENVIESASNMVSHGHVIKTEHLSYEMRDKLPQNRKELSIIKDIDETLGLEQIMDQAEQYLVEHALEAESHNISRAAIRLGITRQSLQYKIKKYNLQNSK